MIEKIVLKSITSTPKAQQQTEELIESSKIYLGRTVFAELSSKIDSIKNVGKIEEIFRSYMLSLVIKLFDNIEFTNQKQWGTEFTEAREKLRQFSKLDSVPQLLIFCCLLENKSKIPEREYLFS